MNSVQYETRDGCLPTFHLVLAAGGGGGKVTCGWTRYIAACVVTLVLGTTALLKLVSSFFPAAAAVPGLSSPNPVFPFLSEREVFLLAAAAELAVLGLFLSKTDWLVKWSILGWLSLAFLFYHRGMSVLARPCNCAGAFAGDCVFFGAAAHLSPAYPAAGCGSCGIARRDMRHKDRKQKR